MHDYIICPREWQGNTIAHVSYSAPTSRTQKLKLMREGGHFTYSSTAHIKKEMDKTNVIVQYATPSHP
jgi:hypothetical protein